MLLRLFTFSLLMLSTAVLAQPSTEPLQPWSGEPRSTSPLEGLTKESPGWIAVCGARVVTRPGEVLDEATIEIRDGRIVSVRPGDAAPQGTHRVDAAGMTIYPGFIDAYSETNTDAPAAEPGYWNNQITPARRVAADLEPNGKTAAAYRKVGVTARLVAPQSGIIRGQSCVILNNGESAAAALVADRVATHMELTVPFRFGGGGFPASPMGAVSLSRQAMLDAQWHHEATAAAAADAARVAPEPNGALEALAELFGGGRLAIAETSNELFVLRADQFAREFGLRLAVVGSGNSYRRIDEVAATGRALIVPVDFPKPPRVAAPDAAADVTLEELMHWRLAPENAARLEAAGVTIALTSHGLNDRGAFLANVRKAIRHGLSEEAALRALTTTPAQLLGVDALLGTIETGKIANLVVCDGDLFSKKTKVRATWVGGQEFVVNAPDDPMVGVWSVEAEGLEPLELVVTGKAPKPKATLRRPEAEDEDEPDDADDEDDEEEGERPSKAQLKETRLAQSRLTGRFNGALIDAEAAAVLSATLLDVDGEEELVGELLVIGGESIAFTATRSGDDKKSDDAKDDDTTAERIAVEVNTPMGAWGRTAPPETPAAVLFRGATVWTCEDEGVLTEADVLVRDGVIDAIGADLDAPDGCVVVDADGKHLTPGLIDCHSHMATDGGLNEAGQAVSAEVRIGDFLDPDDMTLYRQLAGGLTTANVLHGSANPIGGQNQVIKVRWGGTMEDLRFRVAPAGIKFALGENVKQSNWGERFTTRYPQTRMGVDEIIRDRFEAARVYHEAHEAWRANPVGPRPRRDLELDTIAEILHGDRWVHCHSYRQSEILALLRTLESYDVTIGSLQHILEGYKLAPEMAAHGATGSTFSDWWAYKFEVYDAIPYNGALMHEAGVCVSFNSDDDALGRYLNHEAAKAVKYGGVPPEEALKFVTLNPAIQLRIDEHVGSIAVGKHADLALWSGPPLEIASICEQTWIDGRKYFDRADDLQLRKEQAKLHAKLVQAVIDSKEPPAKPGENKIDPATLWPRHDEYCHGHDHGDHHGDHE